VAGLLAFWRIFRKEHIVDEFFDDCDGDGLDWDDDPESEEEPTESGDGLLDPPGEGDWPLIFGISGDIARERRDIERTRREWDEDEGLGYWEWLNRR
jgi:hypothetical protein